MVAMNLSLTLIYGGEEPYARTYSCLCETLHQDRLNGGEKSYKNIFIMVRNLTLEFTHVCDEPYSETYSC